MEFKSLKNIETSFKQIRFFGIVFLVVCAAITGYSVWSSYSFAEAQRQKIYVLDGASRSCWLCPKTFRRTVPWRRGSISADFTNCSLPLALIKQPLKATSTGLCSWLIRVPLSIIRTWLKRGTTTGLFRGTLIRLFRSIAWRSTLTLIRTML